MNFLQRTIICSALIIAGFAPAFGLDEWLPTDDSAPQEGIIVEARRWDTSNMGMAFGLTPFPAGTAGQRVNIVYTAITDGHAYTDGSPASLRIPKNQLGHAGMHFIASDAYTKCGTCGTFKIQGRCGFTVEEVDEDGMDVEIHVDAD